MRMPKENVVFLIYTPGKVGTASIYYSLLESCIPVFHTHSHPFANGFYFFYKYFRTNTNIIAISGRRALLDQAISDFGQNISNRSSYWNFNLLQNQSRDATDFFLMKLPIYVSTRINWREKQISNIFKDNVTVTSTHKTITVIQNKNLELWIFNFEDIKKSFENIVDKIFQITGKKIVIKHHNSSNRRLVEAVKDDIRERVNSDRTYALKISSIVNPGS